MTFSDNVQQAAKDLMFFMKNMPDTDAIELLNAVCKTYNVDGVDVIRCKKELRKQQGTKVYIVLFRQSGDDYRARGFSNSVEAQAYAREFLESFVSKPEDFETLEDLEMHCADKDLAYIDIVSNNI